MSNMKNKILNPKIGLSAFTCPSCKVVSQQTWVNSHELSNRIKGFNAGYFFETRGNYDRFHAGSIKSFIDEILNAHIGILISDIVPNQLNISKCEVCKNTAIWIDNKIVYPRQIASEPAHIDMPESVKELYEEARNISNDSPRAAAALLRVSLEKLTEELGEKTGSLNSRIGNLHKKGLQQTVINSLDVVRISANEGGSHAGEIDLTGEDGAEIVNRLFWLVNTIIEKTISEPAEIKKQFSQMPKNKKDGIKNRDKE